MRRDPYPLPDEFRAVPFSVAQGRASGLGRNRMRGRDLDRPFRGARSLVAATAERPPGALDPFGVVALNARVRSLLTVVTPGTFASHLTAARLWPLPLHVPHAHEPIHVGTLPTSRPPRRPGVLGHELTDPQATVIVRNGLPMVDPATLFCQLAPLLGLHDLVAVGDALVLVPVFDEGPDRPWVPLHALHQRVAQFRGRGKKAAATAVALVRCGAESRPETLVRLALLAGGLPEPELNVDVYAADGRFLGRADMYFRKYRTIVEYDGDHHRTSTAQYDRDLRRIDGFVEEQHRVVRIIGRSFFQDRAAEVARVRRALRDGGWTGEPG